MNDEKAIPIFKCTSPDDIASFYQALGFEVTYRQDKPYVYMAIRRGALELHFYRGGNREPIGGAATCLVMVDDVGPYHQAFASGLKRSIGKVPTSGLPRITRLRAGQKRFTVTDPGGNTLTVIARDEPDTTYPDRESWSRRSPLEKALETAANFRDLRGMDTQAARSLALALEKYPDAPPIERARVLAALAEVATALGDSARADSARAELAAIPLSDDDRSRYRDEFEALEATEHLVK